MTQTAKTINRHLVAPPTTWGHGTSKGIPASGPELFEALRSKVTPRVTREANVFPLHNNSTVYMCIMTRGWAVRQIMHVEGRDVLKKLIDGCLIGGCTQEPIWRMEMR